MTSEIALFSEVESRIDFKIARRLAIDIKLMWMNEYFYIAVYILLYILTERIYITFLFLSGFNL